MHSDHAPHVPVNGLSPSSVAAVTCPTSLVTQGDTHDGPEELRHPSNLTDRTSSVVGTTGVPLTKKDGAVNLMHPLKGVSTSNPKSEAMAYPMEFCEAPPK